MSNFQNVKGTNDLFKDELKSFNYVKEAFRKYSLNYGFEEIETPVFEDLKVFKRENDTSDMVNKEMYLLGDEKELALRPEGTASVIRAFVQHKLYTNDLPYKLFYMEKMYRKERPQKGRLREFTQLGLEVFGDKNPLIDAEVLAFGYNFLKSIGLTQIKILINTLGDKKSREKYSSALKNYFENYKEQLSEDSKMRLDKNPLRILDTKLEHEKEIVKNAPCIFEFLTEDSKNYFNKVLNYLDVLKIPYEIDQKLVRGLDYYTDTVFEVVSTNKESGAQNALFAGGRYDNLVQYFGGPSISGVGFAMGLERLLILMKIENALNLQDDELDVYIIDLSCGDSYILEVADILRKANLKTELNFYDRKIKAQFKTVERKKAKTVVIIGEDEVKNRVVNIKDIKKQVQKTVIFEEIVNEIKEMLGGENV